jgi:outer membrane protein assembly factor BamB
MRIATESPAARAARVALTVLTSSHALSCSDPEANDRANDAGTPSGADAGGPTLPATGWAMFGGDLAHTRHDPRETAISPATVARLTRKWTADSPAVTSTPAIVDGVVYYADWMGGVYAKQASDGGEVWTTDLGVGVTSSPLVTTDRVYISDRKNGVHALVRATGTELWRTDVYTSVHTQLWSSPALADDVLVVGVAGRGTQNAGISLPEEDLFGFRGAVVGLDAMTGKFLWRVETTLDEDGTEYAAGSSVWSSAAVDPELGLAYIGSGNCYDQPASPRSDSLLAIDYARGTLAWHFQYTEGDGFRSGAGGGPDFDVGAAPNLFEAEGRRLVGVGDKAGVYHVHDRETGELVWEKRLSTGSSLGGVMASAAVANGVIYVSSNETALQTRVFALSAKDGTTLWRREYPTMTFGAPALAGGVLFIGPAGNAMYAVEAETGRGLWTDVLPQQRGGGFSVANGQLFTGFGYHFFNDTMDPAPGGLAVYGLGDTAAPPDPEGPLVNYTLLSETGLYADVAAGTIAGGVRPYRPRFELWSDGAEKSRWLYLPEGNRIDTSSPDAWQFPIGTKVWKEFVRDGTRVETRLIEKISASDWAFMAFQWRADQRDADAVPDGVPNASGTPHDIPRQADCTVCHNGAPNMLLGLGTVQLSHDFVGETVTTLSSAGLLSDPLPTPILPGGAEAAEALGYLHANCGFCHNPQSPQFITVNLDLRLSSEGAERVQDTAAFRSTVGVAPVAAPSGETTARVVPGSPASSTVVFRMGLRGEGGQMPPLATDAADSEAIAAISAWITGLAAAADAP